MFQYYPANYMLLMLVLHKNFESISYQTNVLSYLYVETNVLAKKLIAGAAIAGCDAVKFQKRTPELCVPVRHSWCQQVS